MNYDDMPAGREMDALVAEKIMGWKGSRKYHPITNEVDGAWLWPDGALVGLPAYSDSIAPAWEVVKKIISDWGGNVRVEVELTGDGASCDIVALTGHGRQGYADALTVPLSICRAALKAVEGE